MNWFRAITYAASIAVGGVAALKPAWSFILAPVATFLGGWATVHPADAKAAE
jgi:hypothetical protein